MRRLSPSRIQNLKTFKFYKREHDRKRHMNDHVSQMEIISIIDYIVKYVDDNQNNIVSFDDIVILASKLVVECDLSLDYFTELDTDISSTIDICHIRLMELAKIIYGAMICSGCII